MFTLPKIVMSVPTQLYGKSFTQKGNLKLVTRDSAQAEGLQSHKKVHDRTKRSTCRIGNSSTTFEHSGGLKAHQSKFHTQYIMEIDRRRWRTTSTSLTDEERKLCIEFANVYKHLDKGIKGREVAIKPWRPYTTTRHHS
ncbi:hypothetical protein PG994_015201 [Apiospora phragmitis]|uniref:Uncharacterized protein n=1 Tax=Apiospora phragmitis TaxID=2905665 RepID=A0ABR1SQV6_9PEZI